ncbi:hypothetical protein [Agromyces seonyuensis]|uniref:Glycosyltransferase RgtA/B/C/D-like domain-containing protein n=1 Tax=Agromyces seonyuensis TaxID=2662446 RepID=A0A6I4P3U4_9MICO|nr:hypothetical protein [Agromyces seonyuensis]MWB97914.1 hypothetical protein [Agromyces seonyuensis]
MRTRWSEVLLAVGAAVTVLLAVVVVGQSIVLIAGGTVQPAVTVASLLLVLVGLWFVLRRSGRSERLIAIIGLLLVVGVSIVFAMLTIDLSWDGNQYHKVATGALAGGWNPVWESISAWNVRPGNPVPVPEDYAIWNDHYPKASYLFASSLYQLTGTIEAGKAFNALMMFAVFALVAGYLARRIGRWPALTVALLAAVTPVTVAQVTTYYVDGMLGGLILVMVVLLTMWVDPGWEAPDWWPAVQVATLAAAIVVLVNVKFTGLVYAGLFGVVYFAWLCIRWRTLRRAALTVLATGAAALAVGLLVVGASSYVRNTVTMGNPLYPLIGGDSVDIITMNQPDSFDGLDPVSKFVLANLSAASNDSVSGPIEAVLKIPFTFTSDERGLLGAVDVRIGGYGVWFGGILIVALALGVYLLVRHARSSTAMLPAFLLPLVATAIGILIVDGSWWARYTPHLVLLPLIVLIALFATRARILAWLLAALLAVNVALIAQPHALVQVWAASPSLEEAIDEAGGCVAVYSLSNTGGVMPGMLFDVEDTAPETRFLTTEEYEDIPEDEFVSYRMVGFVELELLPDGCRTD